MGKVVSSAAALAMVLALAASSGSASAQKVATRVRANGKWKIVFMVSIREMDIQAAMGRPSARRRQMAAAAFYRRRWRLRRSGITCVRGGEPPAQVRGISGGGGTARIRDDPGKQRRRGTIEQRGPFRGDLEVRKLGRRGRQHRQVEVNTAIWAVVHLGDLLGVRIRGLGVRDAHCGTDFKQHGVRRPIRSEPPRERRHQCHHQHGCAEQPCQVSSSLSGDEHLTILHRRSCAY